MSNIDESNILHSPEMNNNGNNKTTNTNQPDQQCFLERVANHICRHYNWIIVLMLTPISLSYDFYCFGKYMSFNWQQEAQANKLFMNYSSFISIFIVYISVSFWLVNTFLTSKINHEDGVKNIQRQILEWRKTGMKQQMCSARPSWKSISLQNLTYKDKLYKVLVLIMLYFNQNWTEKKLFGLV